MVWAYAQVINEQIPVNKNYNHWSDLAKCVSLDNKTEPKGGGYSHFTVKETKTKTKVASSKGVAQYKVKTTTTTNKPYYLTAHTFGLNIPSNAYVKSVKFIARMKASKGTKTTVPRGRIEINGAYHNVSESGSGKTGWHSGDFVYYRTGNFTTSWKDYEYVLDRANWVKGKFKATELNKNYCGLDLIFNQPTKAGTVYIKWVKIIVDYIVPKYTIGYSIKTDSNNPYIVNTGGNFDLTITSTQTTDATDDVARKILVDVPFGTIINSVTPTNSSYSFNSDGKIEWTVTGKAHGVSKLKLNLTSYTRGLHQIRSSNSYIGSSLFYYYNLPNDVSGDYFDVQLSTNDLRYGVPACLYAKVHLTDDDGSVSFRLFEKHTSKEYVIPNDVTIEHSNVELSDPTIDSQGVIHLDVPVDTDCFIDFRVCYRTPLAVGDAELGLTDDNNIDHSIPVRIKNPYNYVVSNTVKDDEDTFTLQVLQEEIKYKYHRFPTVTDLNAVVIPLGFATMDTTMIMSDCNMKLDTYEAVDYIGVVPLKHTHYNPKNKTTNALLKEQYKNKVYMGKKGVIEESIDLHTKVSPQQATTLQGLVKMDKPTPINANHKCFDGDTLNHRGWVEMHGVTITEVNPHYYDLDIDVTYITHDINTKFDIKRDDRIIDLKIPPVLSETQSINDNLTDSSFNVVTDGTFMYDEDADDGLCNIFTLQNGQYFNIHSKEQLAQETELSFSWICNRLTEKKENKINREIRLVDEDNLTVASLTYHDFKISEDYITCEVLFNYIDSYNESHTERSIVNLRTDIDIDLFADEEDDDESLGIEDIIDNEVDLDDLYGSTVHFQLNNGTLKVIDEGFNGKEFSIGSDESPVKLSNSNLYLDINFENLNDESDDTEIYCFTGLAVMETVLETKYSEQYGDLVVSPFPVLDTAKRIVFNREGEEGTIYYYKDDGGNFKFLLEPYYQYRNGVDLRTTEGISVFDLDNSYISYEIQNGLIGLGFNKLSGDMWLSKYDLQSKEYVQTHYFNVGEDVKFSMPPVSDDRIDLMVNDSVFTVFRGRPYVFVKHSNMDIKILSKFDKVWADSINGNDEDYPVVFNLLNSDNQLPSNIGGSTSISTDDLTITEVDEDDRLATSVTLTPPQTVEANVEATFNLTTSMDATELYELIDLGTYEGLFGTYESSVNVDKTVPYSIFVSRALPIVEDGDTVEVEMTVNDYDGDGINNQVVHFYEAFNPLILLGGEAIIEIGDNANISAKVRDSEDGSVVQDQIVHFYIEEED